MSPYLNRRHFFFGCLALAGCGRPNHPSITSAVSITDAKSYEVDLASTIRRILIEHRVVAHGMNVVLKPNLVEFDRSRPINTNPRFVAAAAEAFKSLGAKSVHIAEGPGHRRATLDLADAAGYFLEFPQFEKRFTDLNLDDVSLVPIARPFSKLRELYLPNTVLRADLLVTLPKMKTHHWAGATLAMKNLFGVVPGAVYGWPKNPLHWAGIDESIADLHQLFPRQFCLVDAIDAMEGNGPILGTNKSMGLIVAGAHPALVDATCCRLMRIDSSKLPYLTLTLDRARLNEADILAIGESIHARAVQFALPPGLDHLRLTGNA
jgi:uncharacterized protein (DUF362 family)